MNTLLDLNKYGKTILKQNTLIFCRERKNFRITPQTICKPYILRAIYLRQLFAIEVISQVTFNYDSWRTHTPPALATSVHFHMSANPLATHDPSHPLNDPSLPLRTQSPNFPQPTCKPTHRLHPSHPLQSRISK